MQGDLLDGEGVYALNARLRLRGVVAESMSTVRGRLARSQLALLLSKAKDVTATIYGQDGPELQAVLHADGLCVNDWMAENLYVKVRQG